MKTQLALDGISSGAAFEDQLKTISKAINQIIQNIATQGQINARFVARLLELEQKVDAKNSRARKPALHRKK